MLIAKDMKGDLTRIALFGLTLEVSRYVAREVLNLVSHNRGKNVQKNSIEPQIKNNSTVCYSLSTISAVLRQTKCTLCNLLTRRCYTLVGIAATPPLLLYGTWNSQLSRNAGNSKGVNTLLFCGIYASSVITSFCVMLWVQPSLLSKQCDSREEYDDLGEENDIIYQSDESPVHFEEKKMEEEDKEASEDMIISPPRPPLPSNTSRNNIELSSPMSTIQARPPMHNNSQIGRPRSDSFRSMVSENSMEIQPSNHMVFDKSGKKYLEILVHNISHTDMILGLSSDCKRRLLSLQNSGIRAPFTAQKVHNPTNRGKADGDSTTSVSMSEDRENKDEKYILSRPRFSAFDMFSKRIVSALNSLPASPSNNSSHQSLLEKIINYPRYERSNASARYTLVTPRPSDQYMLPVGFNLEHCSGENNTVGGETNNLDIDTAEDLPSLRLRGCDIAKVDRSVLGETPRRTTVPSSQQMSSFLTPIRNSTDSNLRIGAVFFPLLSTLLPRWLGQIADKFGDDSVSKKGLASNVAAPLYAPNVKKVIVLVSGVGTPRNWTHSINGNSTRACADLMETFINTLYPDVTVVKIHSETNIFRWEENITFATEELMPCIDSYRDAHARGEPYPDEITRGMTEKSGLERNEFNPDWKQSVSVTYSFADGSAARSFAIQSALRPYRPTYFHFWQLKTFWHESKITDEDIEVHSFEEMETSPPMAVDQTSGDVKKMVDEMIQFRKDFLESVESRSDLKKFWLRKTKKPVLAVLLVRKPDGTNILYRGQNMEVSMPTGSLCAERNVIGTALANNPGLKREDLVMVAVLAVTLPETCGKVPSPPPGPLLCQPVSPQVKESTQFVLEVEEKLKQHQNTTQGNMRRVRSSSSFASIAEDNSKPNDWEMDVLQSASSATENSSDKIPDLGISHLSSPSRPRSNSTPLSGSSTPKRRITLYGKSSSRKSNTKLAGGVKKQKETLVLQSVQDLNPLKPCGACNEWLKKIAESNPHFKVLTFTDTQCNGVYVSPCQE